jgi:hypothetical protein
MIERKNPQISKTTLMSPNREIIERRPADDTGFSFAFGLDVPVLDRSFGYFTVKYVD